MPRRPRLRTSVSAVILGLALAAPASAAPSASLEQVRNGVATATTTPVASWGTGNAGASNSHYLESHSIAYRTVMDGLPTDGTVIELIVGYDVKRSGSYAIDYLTHYQRVLPHVLFGHNQPEVFDPLAGVSGVGAMVTTAPIPVPTTNVLVDPDGGDPEPAAMQPSTSMSALSEAERVMTLFGGTILDVSYVTQADVGLATSSSETRVKVRFTASTARAVLAWGGHIGCRWDWGFNGDATPRSAGGISGSSYHMRLVNWNLGSLGNQDRSMSTDAVYPVPRCVITNLGAFCGGTTNTHTAPSGMETYQWSLYDNTSGATIVGSDTSLSVVVHAGTGGSYGLLLTTGASGFTKQCQATVRVDAPPTAQAGVDQLLCATAPQATLAGLVSGGTGSWSGGGGLFSPSASALDATYTPTAAEIAAGGVTLTLTANPPAGGRCAAATDAVRIAFQRAATANAGPDQVVCASGASAQLAGAVGGSATGGTWSGGEGVFSPGASTLNARYIATAAEIAAGGVTLTLTSTGDGPCPPASDEVRIAIQEVPTASAGPDQLLCASAPVAQLDGSLGGSALLGAWSGGAGTFSPNASALNARYTPTAAEIAAGGVTLTLATIVNGPCPAARDQVRIDLQPAATANAGPDQAVCAGSPSAQLSGTIGGAAIGGVWSGGAGVFTPSASALNAVYQPTTSEIADGGVTLTLTTINATGPCPMVSDDVRITIDPSATVNAGADQVVCASSPQTQLAGFVGGGGTSGTWTGGAGTFSPNAWTLGAVYTPSAGEIAAGSVTLTLVTNDPAGPCGSVADAIRIDIRPAAVVSAGADQSVCASDPRVQLAGSFAGGASSGSWSGGAGSFDPGPSSPNARYTPSAGEIAAHGVTLNFTTNDPSGPCPSVSDAMRITIHPVATANAGSDQRVCSTSPQVQLAGAVGGGATSGVWSGGAGTFAPNASALNARYTPSAAEIAAGRVTLTLDTNDPDGPCAATSDAMTIVIDPATQVNAGPDVVVCSSSPQTQLQGSVSGTVSSGSWSGGQGTFSPGASSTNPVYTPSAAEIAAGSVTLTITSAAPTGPCPVVSDAMTIVIRPALGVNAGPDQMVCAASPTITLAGSVSSGATGALWTGGAGSFSPNASTLNASYTPTPAEIAAGSVTLTLTTNDPDGPCPAVSDQVKLTWDAPTVSVPNRVLCSGTATVSLCATPAKGVAPYAFLWSTGATTQCISVADTGSYSVTITDAKGCQAQGTGGFRWRECTGMIAHTITSCESYQAGEGSPLWGDVHWAVRDNFISTISPGVFFYFTKVNAPSPDFTVDIVQTKDSSQFPFLPVLQDQVTLNDGSCTKIGQGSETSSGQTSLSITGAQVGAAYIIAVKYSLKELVGVYMSPTMGVHYSFQTMINGQVVDSDPEGIQIGVPQTAPGDPNPDAVPDPQELPGDAVGVGDPFVERLQPYRAVPNPFHSGMKMAYDVAGAGEAVRVGVYDVAGRHVRTLQTGFQAGGRHLVQWDGRDENGIRAQTGLYFVHLQVGARAKQVRVTFLE